MPGQRPLYFGPTDRRLFGWFTPPAGEETLEGLLPLRAPAGLIIVSPFGYEAICAHRSLRHFAEAAAAAGIPALRYDHDGTGDSMGHDRDPDRIGAWIAGVHLAADELRAGTGVKRIILLGVRLGAALGAMAALEREDVAGVIAIAPVVSGRAYVRELRALQMALNLAPPPPGVKPAAEDEHEAVGFVLTAETREALGRIDLTKTTHRPADDVLILDRSDLPTAGKWRAHLQTQGATVDLREVPGYVEMVLDPHNALVPADMIRASVDWMMERIVRPEDAPLSEGAPALSERWPALSERWPAMGERWPAMSQRGPALSQRGPALSQRFAALSQRFSPLSQRYYPGQHGPALSQRGPALSQRGPALSQRAPVPLAVRRIEARAEGGVIETATLLDQRFRVFGIVTSPPPGVKPARPSVLLLNAGAVPHVGPNRLHVVLARRLAALGHTVLRMDLAGLGDSRARPDVAENTVYSSAAMDDVLAGVAQLSLHTGGAPCAVVGLCSGAYHAFKAGVKGMPIARVIAINPLTFFWKPHLPLDVTAAHRIVSESQRVMESATKPDAWKKLLSGKVNLGSAAKVVGLRAAAELSSLGRHAARRLGVALIDDLPYELLTIARNRIDLRFVFASDDPGLALLRMLGGSTVKELQDDGALHIEVIEGPDHTFTQVWSHELFLKLLISQITAPLAR